jgi:hypothetical protein
MVKLQEGETVLQIPNFDAKLKAAVQSQLVLENKSLKQFTHELYADYLKKKGIDWAK